jgi:hypothetical protein
MFNMFKRTVLLTNLNIWPIAQSKMTDDGECESAGVMSGRGNWSTRRKPAPLRLFPPLIPHELT